MLAQDDNLTFQQRLALRSGCEDSVGLKSLLLCHTCACACSGDDNLTFQQRLALRAGCEDLVELGSASYNGASFGGGFVGSSTRRVLVCLGVFSARHCVRGVRTSWNWRLSASYDGTSFGGGMVGSSSRHFVC